jgi:hypothetical protein
MSDELQRCLDVFVAKASAAGLPVKKPGNNWAPLQPLVRGSHVSLADLPAGRRLRSRSRPL